MSGSSFGKTLNITTWGESHGSAVGVVIDGFPANVNITNEYIQAYMDRRRPSGSKYSTARKESDIAEILSGIFEGKTTGTPISVLVKNTDHHSGDYSEIKDIYRPGHADFSYNAKYGIYDYRGGGRSSGRETLGRVAAGAFAKKFLQDLGIEVFAYTQSIGTVCIDEDAFSRKAVWQNSLYMPDLAAAALAKDYLNECIENNDSAGGVVCCKINGLKAGIGEPVFDKLDARLAYAVMSIGAVKAFEIGAGVTASKLKGSQNNDEFYIKDGSVAKRTNNSGGILGGISDGDEIIIRAHFKPTPSIFKTQKTVNNKGGEVDINIRGRHDPCIVPRGVVVVEAMAALTICDMIIGDMGLKKFDFAQNFSYNYLHDS